MRIAVLGTGNMGSWLVREFSKENEIAVYDKVKKKAQKLASNNKNVILLYELPELKRARPQLLINAVSLQDTIVSFESAAQYLDKSCVITDVASIKNGIPKYYEKNKFRFVSIHPMFGPTFANMNSLKEENIVLIKESDKAMAEFFKKFFLKLGLRIFKYSFEEHDKMMSYSLTLPFISSMVFAACIDTTTVPGTTFSRHVRITKGLLSENDHLLAEILFNNHSLEKIETITSRLEYLKHIIKGKDSGEIKKLFTKLRENIGRV
ncbi:MAG: prephenate dehydrogenase/arogenate dehydrogenase family protein [Planctomycetota bacterium]